MDFPQVLEIVYGPAAPQGTRIRLEASYAAAQGRFEGKFMASAERSLRLMVEHWLAPVAADQVRVTRFRNRHTTGECYVRVEAFNATGRVAMFFFRHRDRVWRIFPPSGERPTMRCTEFSANF